MQTLIDTHRHSQILIGNSKTLIETNRHYKHSQTLSDTQNIPTDTYRYLQTNVQMLTDTYRYLQTLTDTQRY